MSLIFKNQQAGDELSQAKFKIEVIVEVEVEHGNNF